MDRSIGSGKVNDKKWIYNDGIYKNNFPQINGTINLKNSKNDIAIGNVSVPFLAAAKDTQNAISTGKIINGHIGIAQGYLTYDFLISNPTNNTFSNVIIDAGNGKVLYTSPGMSINLTQFAIKGFDGMNKDFGHWGRFHHNNQG